MVQPEAPDWEAFAPPLDPPTEGGLPRAVAERFAETWWETDPWYAVGLMWDHYAGMCEDPAGAAMVSSVSTGAQTVSYRPVGPVGECARRAARASWYFARSQQGFGGLYSVALHRADQAALDLPFDWWQRNLDDPP